MSYAKLTNRGCQNKNKTRSGRLAGNVASLKPNFVCQVERCHNTRERKKTKQREDENDFLGLDVYIFIRTLRRKRLYVYPNCQKMWRKRLFSRKNISVLPTHTLSASGSREKRIRLGRVYINISRSSICWWWYYFNRSRAIALFFFLCKYYLLFFFLLSSIYYNHPSLFRKYKEEEQKKNGWRLLLYIGTCHANRDVCSRPASTSLPARPPWRKKGGENHVTDKRIYLYSTPQDDGKMDPLYSHTQARPLFSLTYKNSYSVSVVVVV